MARFNGREILLAGLKGDSPFIRYSASADGSDFTEEWSEGQNYIGFFVGQEASANKEDYTWIKVSGGGSSIDIVQETGESEKSVMSQKAVTDAIETAKSEAVTIVQETGESEKSVMSQKAVTDAIETAKSEAVTIVQETGESEKSVMSQKAVTDAIENSILVPQSPVGKPVNGYRLVVGNKYRVSRSSTVAGQWGFMFHLYFEYKATIIDPDDSANNYVGVLNENIMYALDTTNPPTSFSDHLDIKISGFHLVQPGDDSYFKIYVQIEYNGISHDLYTGVDTDYIQSDFLVNAYGIIRSASSKVYLYKVDVAGASVDIVQETGSSEVAVMSQNAVTKAIKKAIDDIPIYNGEVVS